MSSSKAQLFAVIGTDAAGLAVAAELGLRGFDVVVSDLPENKGDVALIGRQGIVYESDIPDLPNGTNGGIVPNISATVDLAKAVGSANVVIIAMPPNFHEAVLTGCAGHLRDDQILILDPGGVGGALIASKIAADHGAPAILVCQTSAMPHAASVSRPGAVHLRSRKKTLPLGVFPAGRTEEALQRLKSAFSQFVGSAHVIENGLGRPGLGLHPVPMIMNATKIEQSGPYIYDAYDITPSIGRVIDAVDAERQAILRALGVKPQSFVEILNQFYGAKGANFYEAVHDVPSYRQAKSPPDLNYRYLTEDVPTQAVPAAAIGRALGLETPVLDAIIAFANAMHGVDYRHTGWNLKKLGLDGMAPAQILHFVETGQTAST